MCIPLSSTKKNFPKDIPPGPLCSSVYYVKDISI